jgi:hypothetical protein
VIESRRLDMGRAYSTYGERRRVYSVLVDKSEGRNHLENLSVDGKVILKCTFEKRVGRAWT